MVGYLFKFNHFAFVVLFLRFSSFGYNHFNHVSYPKIPLSMNHLGFNFFISFFILICFIVCRLFPLILIFFSSILFQFTLFFSRVISFYTKYDILIHFILIYPIVWHPNIFFPQLIPFQIIVWHPNTISSFI